MRTFPFPYPVLLHRHTLLADLFGVFYRGLSEVLAQGTRLYAINSLNPPGGFASPTWALEFKDPMMLLLELTLHIACQDYTCQWRSTMGRM